MARRQHGCVTLAQARAAGASPAALSRRVRSGRLERRHAGVYQLPDLADELTAATAILLACPAAVLSHRGAARVLELDGVDGSHAEVTVPPSTHLRADGVHRSADLASHEVIVVGGLRTTDATRTLCDLGAVCSLDVVEQALESALRRRLTSLPRLRWRIEALARSGRSGPPQLRLVLDRRPPGPPTESMLETLFVQCVRAGGLPDPIRQHQVRDAGGRFIARADLAYPSHRVLIELDSWEHHHDRRAFQHDRGRQNALVTLGWTVLRFTWEDVTCHPADTAGVVRAAIAARPPVS
ncbi:MAG TPA: type IV toxin-antitoxin system AbiEi family antitoxin domain-containing protein [Acidimicrobiales bacterium]|nr:type IV toxin-antitoxin system AbiEi family antitoxin domain-containing protein [Acidimicrobiales bacterium]